MCLSSYLAVTGTPLLLTKGCSANAIYKYVSPLLLIIFWVALILNPLLKKSPAIELSSDSASLRLGRTLGALPSLEGCLALSIKNQFSAPSAFLPIHQAGLNPVYIKGPSVFPLPS